MHANLSNDVTKCYSICNLESRYRFVSAELHEYRTLSSGYTLNYWCTPSGVCGISQIKVNGLKCPR